MKLKKIIPFVSLSLLVGILLSFSINSLSHSKRKAFWQDEAYSYNYHLAKSSFKELLFQGPVGQSSPSPLDYLILHGVYQFKNPLNYLGLQPFQYFRLHYIVITWLIFLYLFYLFRKKGTGKQLFLFCLFSLVFLFNSTIYYYSSEMRPYSLWASLSLLFLFLTAYRPWSFRAWPISLILLSFTTTASLLQILSLIGSFFLLEMISQKKVFPKIKDKSLVVISLLTLFINFYYIIRIPNNNWGGSPTWNQLWQFWLPFMPVIISGVFLTWYFVQKQMKNQALASLIGVAWLLSAPAIFIITLKNGYFFDPKQYIYYYPVVFLYAFQLTNVLFSQVKKLSLSRVLVIASIIPFAWSVIPTLNFTLPAQAVRTIFLDDPISIPVNYSKIETFIPYQIPSQMEFVPIDQPEYINQVAQTNLDVWQEYLDTIYPPSDYPRDESKTLLIRARDNSIEIVDIVSIQPAED